MRTDFFLFTLCIFFCFFCLVPGLAEVKIKEEEKIEGRIGVTVTAVV